MSTFLSIGKLGAPILTFPKHYHQHWEIVIYTHGVGDITVGNRRIPFSAGKILCLPPIIPHSETSEHGYTNIHIAANNLPFSPKEFPILQDDSAQQFLTIASQLLNEFRLKQMNHRLIAQDLFNVLVLLINRWENPVLNHPAVDRLKRLLVDNIQNQDFQLYSAMSQMGLSVDHLRLLFTQETGSTPLDYLAKLRLEAAQHFLQIGASSVKEVAFQVGFKDPYYFTRQFHKHVGMTPLAYKKQSRAKNTTR